MTKILVPLDGSSLSERAAQTAVQFAQLMQAEVILLMVLDQRDGPRRLAEAQPQAEQYLQGLKSGSLAGATTRVFTAGTIVQGILETVKEEGVDLVIMSSHGRSGAREQSMGSVARDLVRTCSVPIMLLGLAAH